MTKKTGIKYKRRYDRWRNNVSYYKVRTEKFLKKKNLLSWLYMIGGLILSIIGLGFGISYCIESSHVSADMNNIKYVIEQKRDVMKRSIIFNVDNKLTTSAKAIYESVKEENKLEHENTDILLKGVILIVFSIIGSVVSTCLIGMNWGCTPLYFNNNKETEVSKEEYLNKGNNNE